MKSAKVLDALSATRKGMKCPKCRKPAITIETGEAVIKKYDGTVETKQIPILHCEECGFEGTSTYTAQQISQEHLGSAGVASVVNGQILETILH